MSNTKKVPNPNGRKGGEKHQNLVQKIVDILEKRFKRVRKETRIETSEDTSRYADVAAFNDDGKIAEIYQIGKQNQDGTPVKREREAIAEIEEASGIKVTFTAYNVTIALLILSGIAITAAMCYYHYAKNVQFAFFGM